MSTIVWAEKYRPLMLDDVVGNRRAKSSLRDWAKGWAGNRIPTQKGVILAGPPGVGKTTSAVALANEMSWDYIEMNASDKRTGKELKKIVLPGASTNTFTADGLYFSLDEGKRHAIILDEADNIHSRDDAGGIAVVSELLKTTQQPVVLIVNDLYELTRRSDVIKKMCKVIRFENLEKVELAEVLHNIAESEGFRISRDAATRLIELSGGDARAAINDLQSVANKKDITLADVESLSKRNKTIDIKEGVERLFDSADIKEHLKVIHQLDEDPEGLLLWIDENLPSNSKDIFSLNEGMSALAEASRFNRLARMHSYYRLWSYSSDIIALASKSASRGYVHREAARFPFVLTRFKRRNAIIALKRSLILKLSAYSHTSPRNVMETVIPFMRNAFTFSLTFASAMTRKLELTVEELSVLMDKPEDSQEVERIVGAVKDADNK